MMHHYINKKGFTLAEVLITLGIIGVVAALTLPNLINNYRIKQLEVAFKKTNSIVTTALNATCLEFGLNDLNYRSLCSGNNTDCLTANSAYFKEINDDFLSRFNIVRSTSNTVGNNLDGRRIPVYNFMGKHTIGYGGMYGMGNYNTPWRSVNFFNDGTVVSALTFFYHGAGDGVTLTFDTNGPYRGPNRFGYDIFIKTSGTWYKHCSKTEAGSEAGNYNGRGCYDYALKDVNPDDNTKGYWKSLRF